MSATSTEISRHGITLPLDRIADLCRRFEVRELAVFGSFLRDDFGPDSDIDFLYRYREDARQGFGEYLQLRDELSAIVGRSVDLVPRREIERSDNWVRRRAILDGAEVIHVA